METHLYHELVMGRSWTKRLFGTALWSERLQSALSFSHPLSLSPHVSLVFTLSRVVKELSRGRRGGSYTCSSISTQTEQGGERESEQGTTRDKINTVISTLAVKMHWLSFWAKRNGWYYRRHALFWSHLSRSLWGFIALLLLLSSNVKELVDTLCAFIDRKFH